MTAARRIIIGEPVRYNEDFVRDAAAQGKLYVVYSDCDRAAQAHRAESGDSLARLYAHGSELLHQAPAAFHLSHYRLLAVLHL